MFTVCEETPICALLIIKQLRHGHQYTQSKFLLELCLPGIIFQEMNEVNSIFLQGFIFYLEMTHFSGCLGLLVIFIFTPTSTIFIYTATLVLSSL